MANQTEPTVIKKYANRRLYHTGTSSYVTLEDLAEMVRAGEDFVVTDAKSSEDITRTVLTQIIFEEETKTEQNLLPIAFLRQLIRFYGDSMQGVVPRYLEFSLDTFAREQQTFREHLAKTFGDNPFSNAAFQAAEEQAKINMRVFRDAFRMFNPFTAGMSGMASDATPARPEPRSGADLDELKKQVADMQSRLDKIGR